MLVPISDRVAARNRQRTAAQPPRPRPRPPPTTYPIAPTIRGREGPSQDSSILSRKLRTVPSPAAMSSSHSLICLARNSLSQFCTAIWKSSCFSRVEHLNPLRIQSPHLIEKVPAQLCQLILHQVLPIETVRPSIVSVSVFVLIRLLVSGSAF